MTTPRQYNAARQENFLKGLKKPLATLRFLAIIVFPVILVITLQRITIEQPLKKGDPAPDLIVQALNGEAISLTNLYGQRLVIMFFSVDCPHCKKELRYVEGLRDTFNGRVNFLLISVSDQAKTKSSLDSLGITVPAAIDEDGKARTAFGAFTVPALFLINPQGAVHTSSLGERSPEVRREQLESFLQATAGPNPSAGLLR